MANHSNVNIPFEIIKIQSRVVHLKMVNFNIKTGLVFIVSQGFRKILF